MEFRGAWSQAPSDSVSYSHSLNGLNGTAKTQPPLTETNQTNPIDLDAFKAMVGEDALDMLPELMDIFFDETPEQIAKLRHAMTEGDSNTLANITHTLKGQSASIGAVTFSTRCAELMAMGRKGQLNGVKTKVAQIEAEYKRIEMAWGSMQMAFA